MSKKHDKYKQYEENDGHGTKIKNDDDFGCFESEYQSVGVPELKYSSVNQNLGKSTLVQSQLRPSAIKSPGKKSKHSKVVSISENANYLGNGNFHDRYDNGSNSKTDNNKKHVQEWNDHNKFYESNYEVSDPNLEESES